MRQSKSKTLGIEADYPFTPLLNHSNFGATLFFEKQNFDLLTSACDVFILEYIDHVRYVGRGSDYRIILVYEMQAECYSYMDKVREMKGFKDHDSIIVTKDTLASYMIDHKNEKKREKSKMKEVIPSFSRVYSDMINAGMLDADDDQEDEGI